MNKIDLFLDNWRSIFEILLCNIWTKIHIQVFIHTLLHLFFKNQNLAIKVFRDLKSEAMKGHEKFWLTQFPSVSWHDNPIWSHNLSTVPWDRSCGYWSMTIYMAAYLAIFRWQAKEGVNHCLIPSYSQLLKNVMCTSYLSHYSEEKSCSLHSFSC